MAEQLDSSDGLRKVEANGLTVIEAKAVFPDASRQAEMLDLNNRLQIRSNICRFLIRAIGFSTVCCFALIFLEGFHAWGFRINEAFLRWLCGVTIAQLVAFLGIFTRAVWQKTNKRRPHINKIAPQHPVGARVIQK